MCSAATSCSGFARPPWAWWRSAADGVPQNDHSVAERPLFDQLKVRPHTIREEPFSASEDDEAFELTPEEEEELLESIAETERGEFVSGEQLLERLRRFG